MDGVRRIISVGVVGRHKKTMSDSGGFLGVRGDGCLPVPACIPPVPTSLRPALNFASQEIPSSRNVASGQPSTSADLRRATSPNGGDSSAAASAAATPVRSNLNFRHSRPQSISSSTKRRPRTRSKSECRSRKSEESFQDASLKTRLDFQQEQAPFFLIHRMEGTPLF
jgi:hypothetical protein